MNKAYTCDKCGAKLHSPNNTLIMPEDADKTEVRGYRIRCSVLCDECNYFSPRILETKKGGK